MKTDRETILRSHPLLHLPLPLLPFSNEFRNACQVLGAETLSQLLQTDTLVLATHPRFGYRMLGELTVFLKACQLGELVDG